MRSNNQKIRFKIVLVEKKNKFMGTITNGDVRRNLLSGLDLNDPITSVTNYNRYTLTKI